MRACTWYKIDTSNSRYSIRAPKQQVPIIGKHDKKKSKESCNGIRKITKLPIHHQIVHHILHHDQVCWIDTLLQNGLSEVRKISNFYL